MSSQSHQKESVPTTSQTLNLPLQGISLNLDHESDICVLDAHLTAAERRDELKKMAELLPGGWGKRSIIVDRKTMKIIDGRKLALAWLSLDECTQKKIGEPTIDLIDCKDESEVAHRRFQINDVARQNWNKVARVLTILNNKYLKKRIEDECAKRKGKGKKVAGEEKGDKWTKIAAEAHVSRKTVIDVAKISAHPKKDEYLNALTSADRADKRKLSAILREIKDQDQQAEVATKFETSLAAKDPKALEAASSILHMSALEGIALLAPKAGGLVITSPPYPHPATYKKMGMKWHGIDQWFKDMREIFSDLYIGMDTGAFCCVNLAECLVAEKDKINGEYAGRSPSVFDFQHMLTSECGFTFAMRFVWYKQNMNGMYPSMGSMADPLVDISWEDILVFRKPGERTNANLQGKTLTDLERKKMLSGGFWDFQPEISQQGPCRYPFPEELPYRCMTLFSYMDDLVIDPFCGNGTTAVVAKKLGRRYFTTDVNPKAVIHAQARVAGVRFGDAIAKSHSTINILGSGAARRMMNCPKCRNKDFATAVHRTVSQVYCPCCGEEVKPKAGISPIMDLKGMAEKA